MGSGHGREGRIQALHAQGDLRAADGCQGDRARPRVARERARVPARDRNPGRGPAADRTRGDSRVRHVVALRPGGQIPDRVTGARAGRRRLRLGVSVPRSHRVGAHARDRDHAVGRDRRHAGGAAGGEAQGRAQHRHLQRRGQHGDARDRRHGADPRRSRDRRRVDEGVHVAAGGAAPARAVSRPDPGHALARRRPPAPRIAQRSCRC